MAAAHSYPCYGLTPDTLTPFWGGSSGARSGRRSSRRVPEEGLRFRLRMARGYSLPSLLRVNSQPLNLFVVLQEPVLAAAGPAEYRRGPRHSVCGWRGAAHFRSCYGLIPNPLTFFFLILHNTQLTHVFFQEPVLAAAAPAEYRRGARHFGFGWRGAAHFHSCSECEPAACAVADGMG